MPTKAVFVLAVLAALAGPAAADDLTQMVQQDLAALGYDTGDANGEMNTETAIAISQFQAENQLEITGKPSPQLAGILKARIKQGDSAPAVTMAQKAGPKEPERDPAALKAAQQACLEEKVAAAQASQKKKRGFGSLMRAVTNTATRFGGNDLARQVAETSSDVYDVNATAADWERAADDLGLTQEDLEACRNPQT